MKTIMLVTGSSEPKIDARVAALYAEKPEERRIVRTNADLGRALTQGHSPIVKTALVVVEHRANWMRTTHPNVTVEVVNTDA